MKHRIAFLLLLVLWLSACTGNISGEASGKYETNAHYEYTKTVNGEVVKEIKSKKSNSGGGEVEFNVESRRPR